MSKACVAIIAYASHPTGAELASLTQCLCILGQHPCVLVCPQSLQTDEYTQVFARFGVMPVIKRYDDDWFRSVDTYNKLMLQESFYARLAEWEYMLLYQLDAWVFRDELRAWCDTGVVYAGAPWFSDRGEPYPFAGNGGFSLRHIPSIRAALKGTLKRENFDIGALWPSLPGKTPLRRFAKKLRHVVEMLICYVASSAYCRWNTWEYEDFVFAKTFYLLTPHKILTPEQAAFFAFERFPQRLFAETGEKLPFGCHAFAKHHRAFWAQWIPLAQTSSAQELLRQRAQR